MTSRIIRQITLMLALIIASATLSDAQVSKLKVNGTNIVDDKGNVVKLNGVSFGWHNWWGQYYNHAYVDALKNNWHCNVVRASIGVAQPNDWTHNPNFAQSCLDSVVDEAIKQDMYVIIDFHSHELKLKDAIKFFSIQAKKYGNYPNVIFELFNEPVDQPWQDLKEYAQDVSRTIRKYSDNIILMGTPQWDQNIAIAAKDPIEGIDNLMYTLHYYANTHKDWLRESMEKAIKKGIPVFISECGAMSADGNGELNTEEFSKWTALSDKYSIPVILWSISDKDESCSTLKPMTSPASLDDADLTPWGLMAKQFITERNNF